jgi:hypothetical protein
MALKTEYGKIISMAVFDTLADFPVTGLEHILYKAEDTGDFFTWSLIDFSYIPFGAGGVSDPVNYLSTVTYSEAQTLVSAGELIPGHNYKILGVDVGSYGGTDVIVKALSTKKFENFGSGLFYTPKYDDGIPVWSLYKTITINPLDSSLSGLATLGSLVVANNGALGRMRSTSWYSLQLSDIDETAGDWSSATTCVIEGHTRNIIDISDVTPQTYCIWGGKLWHNTSNLSGNVIDIFNLDTPWEFVPYDAINYNITWDEVEYDFENNLLLSRKDKNLNSVSGPGTLQYFPFGNSNYRNNKIQNSYLELINQVDGSGYFVAFYSNEIINSSLININLKYIPIEGRNSLADIFVDGVVTNVANNNFFNTNLSNIQIGGNFNSNELIDFNLNIDKLQGISYSSFSNKEICYYTNINTVATGNVVFNDAAIYSIPQSYFIEEVVLSPSTPYDTTNGVINIGITIDATPLLDNVDLGLLNSLYVRRILLSEFIKTQNIRLLYVDIVNPTDGNGTTGMKVKLTRI